MSDAIERLIRMAETYLDKDSVDYQISCAVIDAARSELGIPTEHKP